jgi:hypothetical protein
MGDDATADALKGWKHTYENLLKFEGNLFRQDRAEDLYKALGMRSSATGKQCAKETLEAASRQTPDEILSQGLKVSEKIKDVHPTMYHYADESTLLSHADDVSDGVWRLHEHSSGRYIGPEEINIQSLVQDRLQLPKKKLPDNTWVEDPTKGRFKCVIETVDIADDCRIPRGATHSSNGTGYVDKDWLEPVVTDNPSRGGGGAIQFTQRKAVRVTVFDLKTNPPTLVRNKQHLQQLLETP